MRKKEKKKSNREGFEAFLSKTAIGREYLEEIEDTINDLRTNTRQLDSSEEQQATKEDKKIAKKMAPPVTPVQPLNQAVFSRTCLALQTF